MSSNKVYIVGVDMGYGHERAVYPLVSNATTPREWQYHAPTLITANHYPEIPTKDWLLWLTTRKVYESFSRMHGFPILGKSIFHVMDYVERIPAFYPKRDLSKPPFEVRLIYSLIRWGFGRHLIETLNKEPLPLITSFFITAFFAEEHGYKGEIYCLCTDTDISRAWVPLNPKKSRITYLAPNHRVKERLLLYGVQADKIVVTGFPLPKEPFGPESDYGPLKAALHRRISVLDPKKIYQRKYEKIISLYLGEHAPEHSVRPLTITFAVGGAGAQWNIGSKALASLSRHILEGKINVNLVAGSSEKVRRRFEQAIFKAGLQPVRDKFVHIIFNRDKYEYFKLFNQSLRDTDILWTKPSELSFFVGLGLPIIMSPALGVQEQSNKAWLLTVGAGFEQEDPRYADEWLFDWLNSGWLAGAAMNGFINAPKRGTYHVEDLLLRGKKTEIEDIHFI